MQIVIDIPDAPIKDYQDLYFKIHGMAASEGLFDDRIKSQRALALKVVLDILGGIVDGTPLPKGHGKLIEINTIQSMARKKAEDCFPEGRYDYGYRKALFDFAKDIDDAPTIIEADKAESEGNK